jgi:hypothetical protein
MSITLTITANDAVELGAKIANLFHTITGTVTGPMIAEDRMGEGTVAKKPRGRKPTTIEGTVNKTEEPTALDLSMQADAGDPPAPEFTQGEVREAIIAWISDTAQAVGGDANDEKQKALAVLRDKFGFQKVGEIDPAKYAEIMDYLKENQPASAAD